MERRGFERQVEIKCILCLPRIEEGVPMACARQCLERLRFVVYRDDPAGPIWKLVEKWKVALPLHPEYGLLEARETFREIEIARVGSQNLLLGTLESVLSR